MKVHEEAAYSKCFEKLISRKSSLWKTYF